MKNIYGLYGQTNWLGKPNWHLIHLFESYPLALNSKLMYGMENTPYRNFKIESMPLLNFLPIVPKL